MFMFNFCVIIQLVSSYRSIPSTNLYCKYVSKTVSNDDEIKWKYTSVPVDDNEK